MNSQQMMEEIDRLARLCAEKDAENVRLNEGWHNANFESLQAKQQLSESQAQIAMQAEALKISKPIIDDYEMHLDFNIGGITGKTGVGNKVSTALSATSETVAAWRAKETEPLRREVAMMRDVINEVLDSEFEVSERGISRLIKLCEIAIDDTQATALAYEREVENRGAVKALEKAASKFDSGDWFARDTLLKMSAERAANKGEVK